MEDNLDVELEPYEEVVRDLNYSTPLTSRSASPVNTGEVLPHQVPFQEPIPHLSSAEAIRTTNSFTVTPRSALRSCTELANTQHEPRKVVAATLAPNVGLEMGQQQNVAHRISGLQDLPCDMDVRPATVPVMTERDVTSYDSADDRTRSAPVSWMAAVTARVNALWDAFYRRPTVAAPMLDVVNRETVEDERQDVSVSAVYIGHKEPSRPTEPPSRKFWRIDSENEIDLDRIPLPTSSRDLDLRIPSRTRQACIDTDTALAVTTKQNPIVRDRVERNLSPDQRRVAIKKEHSASERVSTRRTSGRTDSRQRQVSRQDSLTRMDRSKARGRDGRGRSTESRRPTARSQTRPRHDDHHARRDASPPEDDDDDGDSSDSDDRHRNYRRHSSKRRGRPRRGDDSSPEDDNDGDGPSGGNSSENDESLGATDGRKQIRIKLQKFDGTGSWESWWAHFQNCAAYNRWTKRDQLAFMKGALTGNAAQVLWDTDRSTTGSLRKLIAVLKSRYSGERQAEKYRAELQIRRRKSQESLSELHQDIRRLTVLGYPKLTAEGREQIGCDHFTNALGDPDFALKVKERAPKSLDEALCIALRLEAWEKSVKQDRQEDDRPDRPRQKIRATTKPDVVKAIHRPESNDRLAKIEAEMGRLHEKLSKLTESTQSLTGPTDTLRAQPVNYPGQRQERQATASAGEGPPSQILRAGGNVQPLMQQTPSRQTQPVLCWDCGFPGHIRRNCAMRDQGMTGPQSRNSTANRGLTKMQDKANVYLKMSLLGKEVPVSYTHLTLPTKRIV